MSRNVRRSETYPLINTKDAAEQLGVSTRTAFKYAREGQVPAVRIGRSWRYPANLLDRMMKSSAASASEGTGNLS